MRRRDAQIPSALNVAIAVTACSAALGLLWAASHTASYLLLLLCAVAFSYVNNTVFALMHEAVHGVLHSNRSANDWIGRGLAGFFPTGLTFHRTCHLGHHRRNRTAVELFDYYTDGDSRFLKRVQWYGILTGLYWLIPPAGCLLLLVCPTRVIERLLDSRESQVVEHVGAEAMLAGFTGVNIARIRLEILLSIAVQTAMWMALDLSFVGWAACYGAFAVNWSSLQYADHAWPVLDVREGAWNLKVNRAVQYLFLNYHHHLAHHRHPDVPWIHLGRFVDEREPRPSFSRIYLSMWKGPRYLPPGATVPAAEQP